LEITSPIIVLTEYNCRTHFIVIFEFNKERNEIIFFDPYCNIQKLNLAKFESLYRSNSVLTLFPKNNIEFKKKQKTKKHSVVNKFIKKSFLPFIDFIIITILLGLIISCLSLSFPIFMKFYIDDLLPSLKSDKIFISCLIIMFLIIFQSILNFLRRYFNIVFIVNYLRKSINNFLKLIYRLPEEYFLRFRIGDFTSRIGDITNIQKPILNIINNVFSDFLVILLSLTFIFYFNYVIGFILITLSILYFSIILSQYKVLYKKSFSVLTLNNISEGFLINSIENIESIIVNNKQKLFLNSSKKNYKSYFDESYSLDMKENRISFYLELLNGLFIGTIFITLSHYYLNKQITLGYLLAILQISLMLNPIFLRLALLIVDIIQLKTIYYRFQDFQDFQYKSSYGKEILRTLDEIRIENVLLYYPGSLFETDPINWHISNNVINVITGEIGSGKSSFLKVLGLSNNFYKGDIFYNEININNLNVHETRNLIGYLPNELNLFSNTILFNIAFNNSKEAFAEVNDLIKFYDLEDCFKDFSNYLYTIIGESNYNISTGQKKIIGILRELYKKPKLFILDEPTSSVDLITRNKIIRIITMFNNGNMVLISSHDRFFEDYLHNELVLIKK
jgi:ATP-binding cassette, subfamily C, bacteriocin exporter